MVNWRWLAGEGNFRWLGTSVAQLFPATEPGSLHGSNYRELMRYGVADVLELISITVSSTQPRSAGGERRRCRVAKLRSQAALHLTPAAEHPDRRS